MSLSEPPVANAHRDTPVGVVSIRLRHIRRTLDTDPNPLKIHRVIRGEMRGNLSRALHEHVRVRLAGPSANLRRWPAKRELQNARPFVWLIGSDE